MKQKPITPDEYARFVKAKNYRNISHARYSFNTAAKFNTAVREFLATVAPENEVKKAIKKPIYIAPQDSINVVYKPKKLRRMHPKGPPELEEGYKEIPFSPEYVVYKDGRVFKKDTRKLVKPGFIKNKFKKHIRYNQNKLRCLASRLVMFVFGDHPYKDIKDMPLVSYKDLNEQNVHIDNLEFNDQSTLNKKYGLGTNLLLIYRGTIKLEDKDNVIRYLSLGLTYKEIGKILDTTEMCVYRFVKKHNLNKKGDEEIK